jgi:hypothetical protein
MARQNARLNVPREACQLLDERFRFVISVDTKPDPHGTISGRIEPKIDIRFADIVRPWD